MLEIKNLHAGVDGTPILNGLSLAIQPGEVHAIMGPNGSGKSTLSHVIAGRPGYEVLGGSVRIDDVELLDKPTWQRAEAGLFLAM
ncbi:MAG: ATP-binding cassette domain-containing protein, partial [Parvibaculales bacterium]